LKKDRNISPDSSPNTPAVQVTSWLKRPGSNIFNLVSTAPHRESDAPNTTRSIRA